MAPAGSHGRLAHFGSSSPCLSRWRSNSSDQGRRPCRVSRLDELHAYLALLAGTRADGCVEFLGPKFSLTTHAVNDPFWSSSLVQFHVSDLSQFRSVAARDRDFRHLPPRPASAFWRRSPDRRELSRGRWTLGGPPKRTTPRSPRATISITGP